MKKNKHCVITNEVIRYPHKDFHSILYTRHRTRYLPKMTPKISMFVILLLLICVKDSVANLRLFWHYCCYRTPAYCVNGTTEKDRDTPQSRMTLNIIVVFMFVFGYWYDRGIEDCPSDCNCPKSENISSIKSELRKCQLSEVRCKKRLRAASDRLKDLQTKPCDNTSMVTEAIRKEKEVCNRKLQKAQENLNKAVTQNVRTTITDLATETRFCIRLSEADCRGQSSTCVWDSSLSVSGTSQGGACLSARFE